MDLGRFSRITIIISVIAVLMLPAYIFFIIGPVVYEMVEKEAGAEAVLVANHLLSLTSREDERGDLVVSVASLSRHDSSIRSDFNIQKIKLYSPRGEVLFSSIEAEIGSRNDKAYFHDVVALGEVYTDLAKKVSSSPEGVPMTLDVVAAYVPIMTGDRFQGAFEIYFDITDRKRDLEELMAGIYYSLIPVVVGLLLVLALSSVRLGRSLASKAQVELALAGSESRFRELFSRMSSGVAVFRPKDDGEDFELMDFNRAAEKLEKVSRKDVLDRRITDVFPEVRESGLLDVMRRVQSTGQDEHYPSYRYRGEDIESLRDNAIYKLSSGEVVVIFDDLAARENVGRSLQINVEKLRKSLAGTIRAMALMVETRDPFTAGHQRRVTDVAMSIAREMGLPQEMIEGIRVAATIHDLGKLSVPAETLSKPGSLSELEYALIQVHPQAGYGILEGIEFPWPVAQIVYQHHERLDGSGYPRGLTSKDILLEARVLAVADVVEAMASHRPYRPARKIERVLDEIVRSKGILFDDAVVDACARLFIDKKYEFLKLDSEVVRPFELL